MKKWEDYQDRIPKALYCLRILNRFSQHQLGELANVHQSYICHLEKFNRKNKLTPEHDNSSRSASIKKLHSILNVFDISLSSFFNLVEHEELDSIYNLICANEEACSLYSKLFSDIIKQSS